MPTMLRERNSEVRIWMNNRANELKGNASTIDDFVKRSQSLKVTQKLLPRYRQRLLVIMSLTGIMEENKIEIKKDDKMDISDSI